MPVYLRFDFFLVSFIKKNIFNFLFHNSHDKFDRQIMVLNLMNQIESWRKCRCCDSVWKRVCCPQGVNSWPRAWRSIPMIRAKCDTTQLFRLPKASLSLFLTFLASVVEGFKLRTLKSFLHYAKILHTKKLKRSIFAFCMIDWRPV